MQDYIRKYFWVVGLATVLVCAFLAAKTLNNFIEGKYLSDSAEPAKVKVKRSSRRVVNPATRNQHKIGTQLADRNMFCADCQPEEPTAATEAASDGNTVPFTSLPLELVATNVSQNPANSFATIRNSTSKRQGAYWIDSVIPDAGKVVAIGGKHVEFLNESSNRRERVSLEKNTVVARATPTPAPAATPDRSRGKKDELAALIDEGVKKVDDFNFEIDESLREKVLANPMSVARGARIVPSVKNGKPNGFKLYAIRPSSVYAKIGFRNGDTIHSINGYELSTPDEALEVYTKLKDAGNLSVSATRRGKPVTLNYTIR